MTLLALLVSAGLIVIAAIHLVWALGIWWPLRDEATLARAVVGTKNITEMPGPVACSLVVVALLFAAAWPWFPNSGFKAIGLVGIAMVFQLRAILAYSPFMKRKCPEQPFRRFDEAYYAPLCIFFGMVFMVLASQAMA